MFIYLGPSRFKKFILNLLSLCMKQLCDKKKTMILLQETIWHYFDTEVIWDTHCTGKNKTR